MKRIVLLDVSAIMYRAFYGNASVFFRTKNGPTGAIYGFVNTLLNIIKEFSPDYIAAAQDIKRSELKRTKIYSEYKGNRSPMPEDLVVQMKRIDDVLDSFGIKRFKVDGYEADDVLGTISKRFAPEGYEVYIVTGDKDLAQLMDHPNIKLALLGKGDGGGFKLLQNPRDVFEQFGVYPEMIRDYFGLIGDVSDNIPGVSNLGAKKAISILEHYKSLEDIYENIYMLKAIKGVGDKLVECIENDREQAFLSRELATIETKIPLDLEIEDLSFGIDNKKLLTLFKELEFKSLIKRLNLIDEEAEENKKSEETKKENKKNKNEVEAGSQLGLFSLTNEEETESKTEIKKVSIKKRKIDIEIVDNEEKFSAMYSDIEENTYIFFYTENIGVAFSTDKKDYYIPLYHNPKIDETYKNLDKSYLDKIFSLKKKFITYNFKNVLRNIYKIPTEYMEFDEMLAFHLKTNLTKETVESTVNFEAEDDFRLEKYAEIFGKEEPSNISIEKYADFLCSRSFGIREVYPILLAEMEELELSKVLKETEIPFIEVLNSMEEEGIMIDPEHFAKLSLEVSEKLGKLEEKVYEIAGVKFNLNSPKQLSEVLFVRMNITPIQKTKTSASLSTNVEVLEELEARGEEIAKYILEYRKLAKLKSTYIDVLPKAVDKNNRIHTRFNQTGTATGRLSSSDPNLQNIPVKTDDGMKIREGFVAREGYKLLGIDYSQIELRVLTEMSADENLIKSYSKGLDLHNQTARKIFNLDEDAEITKAQRSAAKVINFSIIYGKTPFGLAKELRISKKDADEYIKKYFEEYPKVKTLETEIIKNAEINNYVTTYFGRKRDLSGIMTQNRTLKKQFDRMAVNTVIQGTAAEIIKKVMIELYKFLKGKDDVKLLLQVHDELIFEIRDDKVEEYKKIIENTMKNHIKFKNVKLEVNSSVGKNWAEAK